MKTSRWLNAAPASLTSTSFDPGFGVGTVLTSAGCQTWPGLPATVSVARRAHAPSALEITIASICAAGALIRQRQPFRRRAHMSESVEDINARRTAQPSR